ncbi:hypothetical protein B0H19DRAFT_1240417 [Mycena capillaripes]|nr:hypothetical protein B0H19DRAFT_1240417 [Mycena capillaripes]
MLFLLFSLVPFSIVGEHIQRSVTISGQMRVDSSDNWMALDIGGTLTRSSECFFDRVPPEIILVIFRHALVLVAAE